MEDIADKTIEVEEVIEIPAITKQNTYTFICPKCGRIIHVNTDDNITVSGKKNLHKCS